MLKMFIAGVTIPLVLTLVAGSLMSSFEMERQELLETATAQHSQHQRVSFMPKIRELKFLDVTALIPSTLR